MKLKNLLIATTLISPIGVLGISTNASASYSYAVQEDILPSPMMVQWRGNNVYDMLEAVEVVKGEKIHTFVPVGELASALDIKVTGHSEKYVKGWIGDPSKRWVITKDFVENIEKKTKEKIGPGDTLSWNGEFFVKVHVLSKAFGFDLTINETDRILKVSDQARIPLLLARQRAQTRSILAWSEAAKKQDEEKEKLTKIYTEPYAIASVPSLDLSASFSQTNARKSSGIGYYMHLKNQMFYMDANISFNGQLLTGGKFKPNFSISSMNLSRAIVDKRGDILNVSFGDVSFSSASLAIPSIGGGRGFTVFKKYAGQGGSFQTSGALYRGKGTPGNDVEVYKGSTLVYSTVIGQTGEYTVPPQTLFAGLNSFVIKIYDAGGLVSEKKIERSLTSNNLQAGKSSWSFGLLQPNRSMSNLLRNKTNLEPNNQDNRFGASFSYSLGVTENFTNTFGVSYIPTKDKKGKKSYDTVLGNKTNFSIGGFSFSTDVMNYVEPNNAVVASLAATGAISKAVSISLFNTTYVNEGAKKKFKKVNSAGGSISFSMPGKLALSVSTRAGFERARLKKDNAFSISNYLSISRGPISIGHSISANMPQMNSVRSTYSGSVSGSFSSKHLVLNGQMSYGKSKKKKWGINSYSMRASFPTLTKKFGITAGLTYTPNPNLLSLNVGMGKSFKRIRLTASAGIRSDQTYTFSLGFGTSISYIPRHGFHMSGSSAMDRVIVPHYFIDSNNNGVYDKGERNVGGIKASINGNVAKHDKPSGRDGKSVMYRSMSTNQSFILKVDKKSLRDPYIKSKDVGYHVSTPAPHGAELHIPVPMTRISDVEVDVYTRDQAGKKKPVPKIIFYLRKNNKEVGRARSMSGGELYFENLDPGEYELVPAEKQFGEANKYEIPKSIKFTVKGSEIRAKTVSVYVTSKFDKKKEEKKQPKKKRSKIWGK